MEPGTTRRRPSQARARARVDALLDAAGALLVEDGYAALTTNRVAERAGVPVGSLYQYFARKEDLVHALALRSLERLDALLDRLFPGPDRPLAADVLIERGLDAVAALYRQDPGFRAVWLDASVSRELVAADRAHDVVLADRLEALLVRAAPRLPRARRRLVAEVMVQITGSVLSFTVRQGPRRGARALAEGKLLLRAYLRDVLAGDAAAREV